MSEIWILVSGFFVIALLYSSVGFGGGSSYLALLALPLFAVPFPVVRAVALCCNLIVVTGGVWVFYREGKLSWRECWPYLVGSVPLAYMAARFPLRDREFFIVLGFSLAVAAVLLWFQDRLATAGGRRISETPGRKFFLGAGIGSLSGLVGIGGGIFLAPLLHFLKWMEGRRIAALASLFILVNSLSSLISLFRRGVPELEWTFLWPLLLAVLAGGQIGSRLGARWFSLVYIRKATAVLILVAAVNILLEWM